jgi:hypothetical protein
MSVIGGITPSRGWSQRRSASVPVIAPVRSPMRLGDEPELVAGDGAPQVALELHPLLDLGPQRRVEALRPVLAELLRAVHRGVGVAQSASGLPIRSSPSWSVTVRNVALTRSMWPSRV